MIKSKSLNTKEYRHSYKNKGTAENPIFLLSNVLDLNLINREN